MGQYRVLESRVRTEPSQFTTWLVSPGASEIGTMAAASKLPRVPCAWVTFVDPVVDVTRADRFRKFGQCETGSCRVGENGTPTDRRLGHPSSSSLCWVQGTLISVYLIVKTLGSIFRSWVMFWNFISQWARKLESGRLVFTVSR